MKGGCIISYTVSNISKKHELKSMHFASSSKKKIIYFYSLILNNETAVFGRIQGFQCKLLSS